MDTSEQQAAASRERALATAFVRFADALVDDYDVAVLLQDLVDTSVRLMAVDAAGVLIRVGSGLEVAASSNLAVHDMEVFQIQGEEGPCRECVETGEPVTVPDLRRSDRWPSFGEVAMRRGFHAVHAMPLRLRGDVIGGLNLFHQQPQEWSDDDQAVARALADVATIGIIQFRAVTDARQLGTQLQQALNSRVLIEQAKGMIAQQAGIAMDEAFTLLRSYSRNHNRPLRELCRQVTVGELSSTDLLDRR